jgi:hypothetical protein
VISSISGRGAYGSVGPGFQQINPYCYHLTVLLVRYGRVFHLQEGGAREICTSSAVFVTTLVYGAVVQRAYFRRHHFHGPEGGAFDIAAAGAGFVAELAFIAFESAGAKDHGFDNLMQFTQIPVSTTENKCGRLYAKYDLSVGAAGTCGGVFAGRAAFLWLPVSPPGQPVPVAE